jgi:iron complex outermembrane recepter protein
MPPAARPRFLRISPIAAAVLATLALQESSAADLDLNPVVVTGSRAEAESFELPYSIDVVDAARIGDGQLKVNVSEALAVVPGLVVQNRQNYAQDLQISSRGFGARAAFGVRGVKLIADGIPASNPDGQGQAATFNLDTAERIEVLRGPFSTVYGNHAGGVIQIFSRDGQGAPSLTGGVLGGAWDTSKVDVGAEGQVGNTGYLLDASRFDTNGYREHSGATRDQAFAKLSLHPDDDSKLALIASGLKQDDTQDPLGIDWNTYRQSPRSADPVALAFNTRKSIDHLQGGANYERRFGPGRLQVTAYMGTRSVTQFQAIPTGPQANARHSGGVIDFDRAFHGASARWIHTLAAGPGELTLTGGVDYDRSEDDRQGYENFIGSTLGVKGRLRRNETDTVTSLDPYLQASWKMDRWTLQAGLRHSHVEFEVDDKYIVGANGDDSGEVSYRKTTPALGLSYQVNPALNVYAAIGRGFETPTLNELSYSSAGGGFNFDLKPARSRQVEVGAKAFLGDNTRLNAALFQIRTEDELVVAGSVGGRTSYQNAPSTLRQGFELALDSEFSRHWRGRLAFTQLRAIYDDAFSFVRGSGPTQTTVNVAEGKRLPGIPATSLYAELAWTPLAGITTAVETVYRSRVYVEDTNTANTAPSYTLVNLRLAAEQVQGPWQFKEMLRVDNLFDRQHIASVIVGESNQRFYETGNGASLYAGVSARYRF